MNTVGFKGFRKPEQVTDEALAAALSRLSTSNLYVYWTGEPYKMRSASLRSNALRTITEVKTPVPVEELIKRAARISGDQGYNPAVVKSGLYLHRNSKPAVYLALERREDGAFVAATDTPYASGFEKGLKMGDVVIAADAKTAITATRALKAAKKELPAPVVQQIEAATPKVVKRGKKAVATA